MGIHVCIPMSWKMLSSSQNTCFLCSLDECDSQATHHLRIPSVGADVDHRVCGVVVYVQNRRKDPVDPQSPSFLPRQFTLKIGTLF